MHKTKVNTACLIIFIDEAFLSMKREWLSEANELSLRKDWARRVGEIIGITIEVKQSSKTGPGGCNFFFWIKQ